MALIPGNLSKEMQQFMITANKMKQDDAAKAIEEYCNKLESVIYEAIKNITIIIPPGFIQVAGSPSAQVNIIPITLENVIH